MISRSRIKKLLRPFQSPAVSLTRRLLWLSGVEDRFQAIFSQLHHIKALEETRAAAVDSTWKRSVAIVLDIGRQIRAQAGHPLASELAIHYSHCADLLMRHGKELNSSSRLMFKSDDWSVDYVKGLGAYVPGNEVEPGADSREFPVTGMLDDPDCGVFLVLGQSNAANHGDRTYQPKSEVYTLDFMNMHCYRANDPLPGASGMGGSIWSRLGDQLIADGIYRTVLFVPIAFGGTFARDWIQGGSMTARLDLCLNRLYKAVGSILPISAVFWQQGEAEANHTNMTADTYVEQIQCLIASLRERFVVAPVFVATTTLCKGNEPAHDNASQIRAAQRALVKPEMGILPGPDLDQVGIGERYDSCHLSDAGLAHCATLWADVVKVARPILYKPRLDV